MRQLANLVILEELSLWYNDLGGGACITEQNRTKQDDIKSVSSQIASCETLLAFIFSLQHINSIYLCI